MVHLAADDLGDAAAMLRAVERELPGLVSTEGAGDWYVFYDPDGVTVPEQRFPFCTILTGDRYDAASRLDRDASTYRVNVGADRAAYEELFGPAPRVPAGMQVIDTGFDYTATGTLMPHPFYAPLHWICVVNPREHMTGVLATLLERAHDQARRRYENLYGRRSGQDALG